jgi:putative hydrolase of the HAD superfamily
MPEETGAVIAALKARGKRIALVSNADVMEVAAWSQCPFAGLFDSAIFSCAVGWAKPEPEIYQLSLRELGVTAQEAIFVGDGGSGELRGARAVGMTTVMITGIIQEIWPERIAQLRQDADYVIEHLRELTES